MTRSEPLLSSPPACSRRRRQFAQPGQVLRREEVRQRPLDAVRGVNLAGQQPVAQVLGRQVHVDDLVGHAQHVVGDTLLHLHACGLFDQIVEAFQVLDVERGDHVDPGAQ